MTTIEITNANELPKVDLHSVHPDELDTVPDGWQVWQLGKQCWAGELPEAPGE